jgi:hypothetical protein
MHTDTNTNVRATELQQIIHALDAMVPVVVQSTTTVPNLSTLMLNENGAIQLRASYLSFQHNQLDHSTTANSKIILKNKQ